MEQGVAAKGEGDQAASAMSGRMAAVEVLVAYLLILTVIWTPRPAQRFLWVVAAVGVGLLLWKSFDSWKAIGFTVSNLGRTLWIIGAALLAAAMAIVIAMRLHTLYVPAGGPLVFVETYIAYAIWTGVQQFLLQGFFLLRLLHVAPKSWMAALVAATLFAVAHLPNPVLAPATLLWGLVACLLFLRYRNIYPLMVAHAILGITVAMTVPGPVDHNMRVGLGYLTYNRSSHRHHLHRFSGPAQPAASQSSQP